MLFPEKVEDYEYECVIDGKLSSIKLSSIKSKYIVIIFYPLDFSFVCPTEIIKFSLLHDDFKDLGATVVFASADSKYSHLNWIWKDKEDGGLGEVKWPMISDINRKLSSQFNLFNEETGTVMRSTVILDRDMKVLHISANIDPIGRSTKEVLRLLKALNSYAEKGEVCMIDFGE